MNLWDRIYSPAAPDAALARLVAEWAPRRYPSGVPPKVTQQLEKELSLIAKLGVAQFFLSVYEIVKIARDKGILCQGRGSAANSAVCYVLGITAVDPARSSLLFERFLSIERNEPPDIDVDFEHERREEVIQHIYQQYGRDRAGLAATVICYRARSAIRRARLPACARCSRPARCRSVQARTSRSGSTTRSSSSARSCATTFTIRPAPSRRDGPAAIPPAAARSGPIRPAGCPAHTRRPPDPRRPAGRQLAPAACSSACP